jgi:hypothetical protein
MAHGRERAGGRLQPPAVRVLQIVLKFILRCVVGKGDGSLSATGDRRDRCCRCVRENPYAVSGTLDVQA